MQRSRRELIAIIAVLMVASTTLQEMTRGVVVNGLAPTLMVAGAVALGLRAMVLTFEIADRAHFARVHAER